jgi:hypothetical protein
MKKILVISVSIFFTAIPMAHAVCPVCTVAVGAGLGLAEYLGIDDTISGLWIGALIVSMSLWTINWLDAKSSTLRNSGSSANGRKKSNFGKVARNILTFVAYYAIVVLPLWFKGKIGHPYHQICGVDKLLFGIVLGSLLFAAGAILHVYLRKKNGNVSYFQGQKIVFAVLPIIVASIILYYSC